MGPLNDTVKLGVSWRVSHVLPKLSLSLFRSLISTIRDSHFFQVRNVLNLSQGTLGKDLLTTSHTDCGRGKWRVPVFLGSGQVGVQPEKKRLEGKDHGTVMEVRRTPWAGLP